MDKIIFNRDVVDDIFSANMQNRKYLDKLTEDTYIVMPYETKLVEEIYRRTHI